MTTISKLLLGLSKKGFNPHVTEHSGRGLCENYIKVSWKQAKKEISAFFDSHTGIYRGYTRSKKNTNGDITETLSVRHLAHEPNFRKYEVTGKQLRGDIPVDKTKQIVTMSIDHDANVFTVLKQTPSSAQVSKYDSIQMFPLGHK